MGRPLLEALEDLKKEGIVPLVIVAYNPKKEQFETYTFGDQNQGEVAAMLAKLNLTISPK